MSGRRLFAILIGVVGIVILGGAVVLLVFQGGDDEAAEAPTPVPEDVEGTPQPVGTRLLEQFGLPRLPVHHHPPAARADSSVQEGGPSGLAC